MGWIVSVRSLPLEVFSRGWATNTVEKRESQVTKVFCVTNTMDISGVSLTKHDHHIHLLVDLLSYFYGNLVSQC